MSREWLISWRLLTPWSFSKISRAVALSFICWLDVHSGDNFGGTFFYHGVGCCCYVKKKWHSERGDTVWKIVPHNSYISQLRDMYSHKWRKKKYLMSRVKIRKEFFVCFICVLFFDEAKQEEKGKEWSFICECFLYLFCYFLFLMVNQFQDEVVFINRIVISSWK